MLVPPRDAGTAVSMWPPLLAVMGPGGRSRKHAHHAVLALLRALPGDADTSLPALAALVELSPGRLMHVFTDSVGIPLRPYLLWLKLQRAAAAVSTGSSLASAAEQAGFADAAHMTRTF